MRHTLGWINISLYSRRQLFTMNIPPPALEREKKSYTDGNTDINGQEMAAEDTERGQRNGGRQTGGAGVS